MQPEKNDYLDQVIQQQQMVDVELKKVKRAPGMSAGAAAATVPPVDFLRAVVEPPSNSSTDVRITGVWRWKTVVVPPNVYAVHTRRGLDEPVTIGLGKSFKFNPFRSPSAPSAPSWPASPSLPRNNRSPPRNSRTVSSGSAPSSM